MFQNLNTLIGQTFFANSTVPLGPEIAELDGVPVHEVLSEANLLLGGAPSPLTPFEMGAALFIANNAFNGGFVDPSFAMFLTLPPSTVSTVPEPSTWAMMLLGFAGLGFAFRQSRRKVSLA